MKSQVFHVENQKPHFSSHFQQEEEEDVEDEDDENKKYCNVLLRGPDSPLYNAICPMVYAIRVFGFAPYTFRKNNLVPSNINLIFTIISSAFYSYTFYTFIKRFAFSNVSGGAVLTSTEQGKRRGYVRSEIRIKTWAWSLTFINVVLWFSVNQAGMWAFIEPWYKNISYMLLYIATAMVLFKFTGITYILGQRFEYLNTIAGRNIMLNECTNMNVEVDTKWIEIMHSDLLTISENYITLYSWPLFLWLFNLAAHSITNTYFLLEWTSKINMSIPYYFIWCLLSWLMAYMTQLIFLHGSCHFTSSEANCMGYVLINCRRILLEHNYCDVNLHSTLYMLNRKLKFLAAGCFNVNLPLLRSITGLLTTYCVILMQLPDEKDGRRRRSCRGIEND